MTVRSISGKAHVSRGAIATLAALALAFPVAAATTAQNAVADPTKPTVNVKGKVGCDPVDEDFVPVAVEIATDKEAVNATTVDKTAGKYSGVELKKIPKKGTEAEATVTCKSADGTQEDSWTKTVTITRPLGASITRTINLLEE